MRQVLRIALMVFGLVSSSCATGPTKSKLLESVGKSEMTPEELRLRVHSLAPRFSGDLEEIADGLIARNPTPAMRKSMTQFKFNALPAIQNALFQHDPTAAVIDTWALLAQLEDVTKKHPGLDEASRAFAQQRFEGMENEVAAIWSKLTGKPDVTPARQRVHQWAAEHPVTDTLASRVSTAELLAGLTAQQGVSPLKAASTILEATQDLTDRIDTQTTFLPKEARWQAEYFMLEALGDPTFHPPIPELSAGMGQSGAMSDAVGKVPDFIDRQREETFHSIHSESVGLQGYLTREREATMVDADRIAKGSIDETFNRASTLLNRLLIWITVLLVLGGIFALGALMLVLRRALPAIDRAFVRSTYFENHEPPEQHPPH